MHNLTFSATPNLIYYFSFADDYISESGIVAELRPHNRHQSHKRQLNNYSDLDTFEFNSGEAETRFLYV